MIVAHIWSEIFYQRSEWFGPLKFVQNKSLKLYSILVEDDDANFFPISKFQG